MTPVLLFSQVFPQDLLMFLNFVWTQSRGTSKMKRPSVALEQNLECNKLNSAQGRGGVMASLRAAVIRVRIPPSSIDLNFSKEFVVAGS